MNSSPALLRGLTLVAMLIGLLCTVSDARASDDAAKPAPPADLQLTIGVPPTWRPFLEDDIADSLAGILQDTFKRRGYAGKIEFLSDRDPKPDPAIPLLQLELREWRISRTGNAECTLSGKLIAAGKEHDLGLVTQTDFTWFRDHGRFGLERRLEVADALEKAATGAMRDLFKRIGETTVIPGLPPAKAKK